MDKIKNYFSDWTVFETSWLVSSTVLIVSISIISGDNLVGLIAALTGIVSVVLCAKGKIENYFFGIINAITYLYMSLLNNLYGEVMYNAVMVIMIIVGFFTWKQNMSKENHEVKARNLTVKGWLFLIVITLVSIGVYSQVLMWLGGSLTLKDSASTVLAVVATVLMLARYSDQWLIWNFVNIAEIILWFGVYINGGDGSITMLIMWSAFLINSIYGYINWRKLAKLHAQ